MSMKGATPGPWFVSNPLNEMSGARFSIGSVEADVHHADAICLVWGEQHDAGANSRLIAAAPDLLAAAIKAMDECCDLVGTSAGNALLDAVAKAQALIQVE